MIEKIIQWYLYDDTSWDAQGDSLNAENFENVKPLLSSGFIKDFVHFHGFHDWMLESFQILFRPSGLDVILCISENGTSSKQLHFEKCSGFRVKGDDADNYLFPQQIQIISFEKKDNICIGIALTSGQIIYIYCKTPIIHLEVSQTITNHY